MTIYFVTAGVVLLLAVAIAIKALSRSPTVKGIAGERLTKAALDRGLDPAIYRVLHDVTLPSRYGTTQIDHVVVSRYGVFVLETKHLFGWIFAQAGSTTWTQSTGANRKTRFQNPLRQNHAHVKALAATTELGSHVFVPLVVMTGRAEFRTGMPQGVVEVADLIDEILKARMVRLSAGQVDAAEAAIEAARLEPGHATDTAHIANLRARFGGADGGMAPPLKYRRQALAGLRAVALVLLGAVTWGTFSVFDDRVTETLHTLTQSVEPTRSAPMAQRLPEPRDQLLAPVPSREPSLAFEPLTLPHTQPPAPQIYIEPDPPITQPAKLGTVPPRLPEERLVSTAEQLRLFEATLSCEVTGAFKDCSCYMESGAKVLMGYERCRSLARYNGVEWIARPE